jgi:uncharacterized protein YjbI with pentapeptide repeats
MSSDLILGWALGLASSLLTGLFMFWLEGRREIRQEIRERRVQDIRTARNWKNSEEAPSLRGFDLRGANLSGEDFSGADLEDANLEGARIWQANFSSANLNNASFRQATLVGVIFRQANLHSTNFDKAVIGDSDFTEAMLRRTKLDNTKRVENCIWQSVRVDETTRLSTQLRQEIESQQSESEQDAA